jgi:hypothetical protein
MTLPDATFFDPSFERLPAPISGESASAGPVLLLVDPGADRAWAADAAVALATGWHAAGRRTVLADLWLDDPFLHERIGMPNQEGLVDIFVYGASMARSARPVPGRGFYLISSGTYTPDSAAVLRHARWQKIVSTFRDNEAALLLFAPGDAEGIDALSEWVAAGVVLGEIPPAASERFAVRAWLAPPGRTGRDAAAPPPPRPATPADRFPEPEPGAPWTAPPGTREAASSPAAVEEIPVPEPHWTDADERARPRRAVSTGILVLLMLAVAAGALAFLPRVVAGFPDLLGLGTGREAPEPAPAGAAATAHAGPVEPAGEPLPYSVQVQNFQTWEDAARFAAVTARRIPEAQFFVVVEEDRGMAWWRVMAGIAGDTTEVLALRDRLLAEGILDEESFGGRYDLIQRRPFSYDLGEYASAQAARARADSLNARAIPAYVAPVPFTDGSERWRVYGGAYRDSASAAPMRDLLRGAALQPSLVERTGRPPATPK